jgi:hypothetical protein
MKLTCVLSLVLGLAILNSNAVGEGRHLKATTFSGTWTCVTCNSDQTSSIRDYYFHDYGLVLDNGEYIMILDSPEAETLLKGNGNVPTRIAITGLYDSSSRTLRIQSYSSAGIEYTWCGDHHRMDPCDQLKLAQLTGAETK